MIISTIAKSTAQALKDRVFLALACSLLVLSLIFCLYVGFSLHSSDVQVAVRYTAFGATTYYRDQWYYLVSFIVFIFVGSLLNVALGIRLQNADQPLLSRGWLALAIVLVLMSFIITHSVLGIAYL